MRIVPPTARVSAEEAAGQLNRQLVRKPAAKKGGGRTYNLLSEEERSEFYKTAEFKESGLTKEETDGLITAYAGQGRTSAARALLVDALLFGNAVRRARKNKGKIHGSSATSAGYDSGRPQAADALTAALERTVIGKSEWVAEPFRAWRPLPDGTPAPKPVSAVRAEDAVQVRRLLLAGKDTDRTVEQERNAHNSFSQTQWHPDTAGNLFTANDAVLEQAEIPSQGLPTERQSMRKSFQDDLQDIETSEIPFSESNGTPKRTENSSRRMTERQNKQKVVNNDQQDAGTYENSFFDAGGTPEHVEIPSRHQLTGHKNTQERHYSDRRDTVASENSFPIPSSVMEQAETSFPELGGMRERAGIPPQQPTERQNAREFPSQDWQISEPQVNPSFQTQQVAETYRNSSPRTQQNAGMNEKNPVAGKKTGAPVGNHDIITLAQHGHDEQITQDAEMQRMEKLNAAFEHDRAALAKTDPAFARSTFRDVGHAEGSGEEETSARQANKKTTKIAEKIIDRLDELSEIRLI